MHTEKKSSNSLKTHLSASSSKKDTDVALEPKVAPESNYELIEHDSYDSPKLTFGPGQTKFTNEELAADRERRGNINSDPLYAKVASFLSRDVYEALIARDPANAEVLKNLK